MGTGPALSVFGDLFFYRETRGTRLGDRHVAKRRSDPRVAYPEFKVQVRGIVRVVGIVASFAPRCSVFGENSFYRAPGCTLAGYPQAAVHHERARQSSGMEPYGDCRRVLWVPGPRGQCSGEIRFIENPGLQD